MVLCSCGSSPVQYGLKLRELYVVQRAINGQLITWEVIVYGFLGMEQVAARYKDPWKAAVYCCENNCAEVKMALSEPDEPLPTND